MAFSRFGVANGERSFFSPPLLEVCDGLAMAFGWWRVPKVDIGKEVAGGEGPRLGAIPSHQK